MTTFDMAQALVILGAVVCGALGYIAGRMR